VYGTLQDPEGASSAGGWKRTEWFICAGFVVIFVAYALNFAYFFVDDEAIPFVYAHNVVDGHGLVYNPDDGPVEGYSDFLTIWIDVALLGPVTAAGASRLWAIAIAELVAFGWAIALLVATFAILRKRFNGSPVPLAAGMTFLTLAGPLAVWSWSALETTLFAWITVILVAALLETDRSDLRNDRLILVSVTALMLCRIDGFVWAGALIAPFLISITRSRRWELTKRVILPAAAVFAAYHAWRIWYFGELLPMPVYAKVLYKLGGRDTLISNDPDQPYVIAFLRSWHWIPIVALSLGFAGSYYRSRAIRSLALAIGLVVVYLCVVGDWMFGFRFFVPLLAPMAIVATAGFNDLRNWRPRVAVAALIVWTVALVVGADDFWRLYAREGRRESWLAAPSLDPARFFAPYYQIYLEARRHVSPGDTIAYNQAGFVPFMLDARNIDDLGICTKFYGKQGTTDVVFTEVGRYSPLTARPVLGASETYTLSRSPKLLLAPGGNLRAANRDVVPDVVLGGAYRLLFSTNAVAAYGPIGSPATFRDPHRYLENVAHISHLRKAQVNGQVLRTADYRAGLSYLYGRKARLTFDDRYVADFTFSADDVDVYEVYVGAIRSAQPASIVLMLENEAGQVVFRDSFELASNEWRAVWADLGDGTKSAALSIAITSHAPGLQAVDIDDVRVQGQTPALKHFVEHYEFD